MTNKHVDKALKDRDDTAAWLRTPQAATMAQMDEQMRGREAGLVPGKDDADSLRDWINSRYGDLPPAAGLDSVTAAAREAGRLRQWQAQRLEGSGVVAVHGDVATVAQRLASTGAFTHPCPAPEGLPPILTFAWPHSHHGYGTYSVTGPGELPGENTVCAITLDLDNQRMIEWSPTQDLDFTGGIQRLLDTTDLTLPPWNPAGDEALSVDDPGLEQWKARIIASAGTNTADGHSSLVEQANAVLAAIYTGLVSVKKQGDGYFLDRPVG